MVVGSALDIGYSVSITLAKEFYRAAFLSHVKG
jgi:hypothetical protein